MNILIILSKIGSKVKWHQGVASLAACLLRDGHRVELLELEVSDWGLVEETVSRFKPDLVAGTANSHQIEAVSGVLAQLKRERSNLYTVLGGVHVTIAPESIDSLTGIDAICRGEGEGPLCDLASALEDGGRLENIPNMIMPALGQGAEKPCEYYVKDLNELPIPERSLFKIYRDHRSGEPLNFPVRFQFCRGCPYDCTYCCNHIQKAVFPERKNYVRRVSVDRAIEELELVWDRYRFTNFVIDDDVFTLDPDWVLDFCNRFPSKLLGNTSFEVASRVEVLRQDMLAGLKAIGCEFVNIGLESGDEEIRRRVLNRKISDEMVINAAAMIHKAGLKFQTFNMVGIPGEGRRELLRTIRLNQKIKPDRIQVTIYYPYAHTRLGDHCFESGMVKGASNNYFSDTILDHDRLTGLEIRFFQKWFKPLITAAGSPGRALSEAAAVFRDSPWLNSGHYRYIFKRILAKLRDRASN